MGKTPEEQFLEHLCTLEGKTKKFTGAELLREFNDFCANQGIEWKVTSVQLGVRIGNLVKKHEKVPDEILKNTHKREGVIKEFNLAALRKRLDPTSFVDE